MSRQSIKGAWAAGLAGVLIAVVLAGCTSDKDPTASPTPSAPATVPTTASATGSPTPTGPLTTGPGVRPGEKPPVESDLAKEHTESGAELFAVYFIHAIDWSIATNDAYLIEQIAAPSCTACKNYESGLAGLRARGERQMGGRISVRTAKLVTGSFKIRSDYVIQFQLHESDATVISPATPSPTVTTRAQTYPSLVFVSWLGGRWQIVEQGAPS